MARAALALEITGNANSALRALDSVTSKTASVASRIGSGLGKAFKGLAAGTVAVGIAAVGTALTKGFSRLQAIDQAEAKLRGLGHSASGAEKIMGNATAAVKGTAFGLGEAATVAASAVAAGIKPGHELERVLTTVANTAAASGTSMEEMGAIFNKVATSNKAYNSQLKQLADRGVPIYQALADQLGVTADEVFNLARSGKINFAQFEKAATAASGNVAAEMGKTFTGSLANLGAAIGRIGANLQEGIFKRMPPLFQALTQGLGPVEDLAKQIGDTLASKVNPVLDKIADAAKKIDLAAVFDKIKGAVSGLGPLIAPVAAAFVALGGSSIPSVLGPLAPLFSAIVPGPLVAAIIALVAVVPGLRNAVAQLLPILGNLIKDVGGTLLAAVKKAMPAILSLGETLGGLIVAAARALAPVISSLAKAIAPLIPAALGLVAALGTALAPIIKMLLPIISGIARVLIAILKPAFVALAAIIRVFSAVLRVLAPVMKIIGIAALALVSPVLAIGVALVVVWKRSATFRAIVIGALNAVKAVVRVVAKVFAAVWKVAFAVVRGYFRVYRALALAIFNAIKAAVRVAATVFRSVWRAAVSAVRSVFTGLRTAAVAVFNAIKNAVRVAANLLRSTWRAATSAAKSAVNGLKSAAVSAFNAVTGPIRTVASLITRALSSAFGKARGLASGLGSKLAAPFTALKGAIDSAIAKVQALINKIKSVSLGKIGSVLNKLNPFSLPVEMPPPVSPAGYSLSPSLSRDASTPIARAAYAGNTNSGSEGAETIIIDLHVGDEFLTRFITKQVGKAVAGQGRRMVARVSA